MEEKLNLILSNVEASGYCNLLGMGKLFDYLNFTIGQLNFTGGKLYGIIGEFGFGGAALTNCLAGIIPISKGEIYLNGVQVSQNEIAKISCYVGEGSVNKSKGFLKEKKCTVRKQIENGIKFTHRAYENITDIQKLFGLSDERFDRPLDCVSGERFKASIAIGFSYQKSIYCFPWLNSHDMYHYREHFNLAIKPLINKGYIVIIPTTREKNMEFIGLDYEIISFENMYYIGESADDEFSRELQN